MEACTFLRLGAEGPGCQASSHPSLGTDCALLRQLKAKAKGLAFAGDLVTRRYTQAGIPGPAQASASTKSRGQGRLWASGAGEGWGAGGLLPNPTPGVLGDPSPGAAHPPWASPLQLQSEEEEGGRNEASRAEGAGRVRKHTDQFSPHLSPSPGTPVPADGTAGRVENTPPKVPAGRQG